MSGPDATPILYLHPFHFPAEHAHSVQILHTCRALAALGVPVRLLVKRSRRHPVADVAEGLARYGLEPHPLLRIEWLPTHHKGIAGLAARWHVRRARGVRFYARHERLAGVAARAGGGPVVLELHNIGPRTRSALEVVDGVVTITSPLRDRARALTGRAIPMTVIPDGFDPALFSPVSAAPAGRAPRVVYAGQLVGWKGVDVLLRALARLEDPPLRALVIGGRTGSDPEAESLRALAGELGLAERVEWTGPLAHHEVGARLRAGDVGIVPTRAHGGQEFAASPLKLFEYMASGLPVVASDLPAIRDVVDDGRNGLLFPEGDEIALASALRRLSDDPELHARLSRTGVAEAARYSWSERARRIVEFFGDVGAEVAEVPSATSVPTSPPAGGVKKRTGQ